MSKETSAEKMDREALKYGVSGEYWGRLSERDRDMYREIRPLRKSSYTVNNRIANIERTLADLAQDAQSSGGELELNPDFQRGHVWSQDKQIAFIEAVMRGTAPMVIRFNCPSWVEKPLDMVEGLNPASIQCVDGLQRLTAMREFVAGKFPIFEKYFMKDLEGSPFSLSRMDRTWVMEMFNIPTRKDLLQFYLDLNSGGVVHAPEELERVRGLLEESQAAPAKPASRSPSP